MRNGNKKSTPAKRIQPAIDWADRISQCWRQTIESVIKTGQMLAKAKVALGHGAFTAMIENDLPFGARTAQQLMKVAADPRITNPKHASLLPSSWATLHELTKLDDKQFKSRIKDGTIKPEMERRDIATVIKKTRRAKREAELGAKQVALPTKKYGVILADPEWQFEPWSRETGMDRSADNHYPTSVLDVIKSRDVPSRAAKDCVLYLWATVPMEPQAHEVMKAWGFKYVSQHVWDKRPHTGTGYWNRNQHELLLVGTKGEIPAPAPGTQYPSIITAPVGRHSEKPEVFLEMIESYFPTLPKIELNRRGPKRDGWDAWGFEAE